MAYSSPCSFSTATCTVLPHPGEGAPKALSGFCPVALVSGQGFVLPGNLRLGVLSYGERLYSCSSTDRARQFQENPAMFVSAIVRLVRELPVLEELLNAEELMQQAREQKSE